MDIKICYMCYIWEHFKISCHIFWYGKDISPVKWNWCKLLRRCKHVIDWNEMWLVTPTFYMMINKVFKREYWSKVVYYKWSYKILYWSVYGWIYKGALYCWLTLMDLNEPILLVWMLSNQNILWFIWNIHFISNYTIFK